MAAATQQRQTTTYREPPTQDRAALDAAIEATVKRLDESADEYARQLAEPAMKRIERMVITSKALRDIKAQLTDSIMKELVMPLMNSALGFLTDRPSDKYPSPYGIEVVRDCVIQALLLDFRLTGNEFNIIAGRFYGAQAGYYRKLCDIPNVTNVQVISGVPVLREGRTIVRMGIRCNVDGKPWELRDAKGQVGREFVARINSGSGDDMAIGKAKRKALKAAFEELSGISVDEIDDGVTDQIETSTDAARAKLTPTGNGTHTPNPDADPVPEHISQQPAGDALRKEIDAHCIRVGTTPEQVNELVKRAGAKRLSALTVAQAEAIIAELSNMPSKE